MNFFKMTLVIAHRGASGHAPENTLSSFEKAKIMKADMIEFDVTRTKEGVPIVFHDRKVNRVTGQAGDIIDYTYDKARILDIGTWFGKEFSHERILTLTEALEILKDERINIEIKPESRGIELDILRQALSVKKIKDILFSSFDDRILINLRKANKDIALATLANIFWTGKLEKALSLNAISLNPNIRIVSEKMVKKAHEHNLNVMVWTANQEREMKKLIAIGADGIFTNYPDKLKKILEDEHGPSTP